MASEEAELETWRRRLRFRSWHRGTKELDLLFGPFADARLAGYDAAALARYDALLQAPDPDVFDWILGRAAKDPAPRWSVVRDVLGWAD